MVYFVTAQASAHLMSVISKAAFEAAVEYYVNRIVKNQTGYLTAHIDEICTTDDPELKDTFVARATGYTSTEKSMIQVLRSNTELCKKIREHAARHTQEEFVIVEPQEPMLQLTKTQKRRMRRAKAKISHACVGPCDHFVDAASGLCLC